VDSGWLQSQGAGPYLLDQANTTYVLATDVRTDGTAFVVAADHVTFDLNQHTVVYGDGASPVVSNGGFESGSGRTLPGWDLSAPPTAAIAANTSYLFGNQVLRLGDFTGTQRIVSDAIAIPQAGRIYAATITPAQGDYRTTLSLSVIDTVTGAVLATGK